MWSVWTHIEAFHRPPQPASQLTSVVEYYTYLLPIPGAVCLSTNPLGILRRWCWDFLPLPSILCYAAHKYAVISRKNGVYAGIATFSFQYQLLDLQLSPRNKRHH
jgi:hypothetical protein